jgi:hypothetical protein
MTEVNFDGFYFVPDKKDLNLLLFVASDKDTLGSQIESNSMGEKYHIIAFKKINDIITLEQNSEAILIDPFTFIRNYRNLGLSGCILKKTINSTEWVKNYIHDIIYKKKKITV